MTIRIPLSQIVADPSNNARSFLPGIPELAKDIETNGLLQPLVVTAPDEDALDARYVLRAGFRRFAALQTLGITEVDVTVSDKPGKIINLVENWAREDISVYDFATAIMKLNDEGMTAQKIGKHLQGTRADAFGSSTANLGNLIRLRRNLAPAILEQWAAGHPAATTKNLMMIVGKKNTTHEEQIMLWNRLTGLEAEQAEERRAALNGEAEEGDDDVTVPPPPKKRTSVAAFKMLEKLDDLNSKGHLSLERLNSATETIKWVFGHSDDLFGVTLTKDKEKPLQDAPRA